MEWTSYSILKTLNRPHLAGITSDLEIQRQPRKRSSFWNPMPQYISQPHCRGNNVQVFKGQEVQRQSDSGPSFENFYNDTNPPPFPANLAAARTNAFYIANTVHDFAYRYGFTETAFNYQLNNFGKARGGNDQVLISVQDASGKNNANFASPPE